MRSSLLLVIVLIQACAAQESGPSKSLTFIHMNDTYRVDAVEEGRSGGFGRVVTIVRELKAEGRDVRILHGGDFLYPSLESQLWDGEQMVEAMNYLDDLAPMYAVPGNHEFDPGDPSDVAERIRESRFDWLADNLSLAIAADVDERLHKAFTFEAGGRKVGILSLTLFPEDGGNDRAYTPFSNGSYLENAERVIRELESQGVDLIVGLTHLHIGDDLEIAKLKARHPKFMFIVGGHEHEPEYHQASDGVALVAKGASNARTVWRIDVDFTDGGPKISETLIRVDESIVADPAYQPIADKWRGQLLTMMPFLPGRLADAAVPLDGRETAVRNADSNWGTFIADQMRTAFPGIPADLALVNGGTLRIDDFIAEDITWEDIARTFGFSSHLRHLEMQGKDFRDMLEAGYRGRGPSKGYFPQISGFRVCVDRRRSEGQRIVELQVPADDGWAEIDGDKVYTVVAPDYLVRGGDGYDFSQALHISPAGSELKYLVLDAVMQIQAEGGKVGSATDPDSLRFNTLPDGRARCFD